MRHNLFTCSKLSCFVLRWPGACLEMKTAMETPMPVPRKGATAGFSMIELLVVVALIAIMAAFALPGIAGYIRNYRIRGAVNEVASALEVPPAMRVTPRGIMKLFMTWLVAASHSQYPISVWKGSPSSRHMAER